VEALSPEAYLTAGPLGADRAHNSFALAGSLGLMLGVGSMAGPEGLGSRVDLLYRALKALLEVTGGRGDELRKRVDATLAAPLSGPPDSGGDSATVLTLRFDHAAVADGTELTWLVWSEYGNIMRQTTDRWRPAVRRDLMIPVPAAWLIEAGATEWADLVRAHGFEVKRLTGNVRVVASGYTVGLPDSLSAGPSESTSGGSVPDASSFLVTEEREFAAGSWIVRSNQRRARLLFTVLEPWSQDAPLGEGAAPVQLPATPRGAAGSSLHPVFRIDARTLARLETEAIPGSERRDTD
jgi:hypothetical protein